MPPFFCLRPPHIGAMQDQHSYFRARKGALIKILGRRALSDHDVETAGRALYGKTWGGVWPHDEFTAAMLCPRRKYVINTGHSRGAGIHWTGLYSGAGKTVYVYDSFGRATGSILPELKKRLEAAGYTVVESERDAEQRGRSQVCGVLALAWLEVVNRYGITAALEI